MAEASLDLMLEILKSMQDRQMKTDAKIDELKAEMQAFRGHMISLQQDVHNIYAILGRHEARLERIERRLDLVEPVR
jgi:chromosome segregation ATPase